jgi:hypothetical protein
VLYQLGRTGLGGGAQLGAVQLDAFVGRGSRASSTRILASWSVSSDDGICTLRLYQSVPFHASAVDPTSATICIASVNGSTFPLLAARPCRGQRASWPTVALGTKSFHTTEACFHLLIAGMSVHRMTAPHDWQACLVSNARNLLKQKPFDRPTLSPKSGGLAADG